MRGYSLIEIAIALAVVGVVVGGALMPLHYGLQKGQYRQVKQHLAEAKTAINIYAVRHSTVPRRIGYHDGVNYTVPVGRPYLPCPDTNNDGFENRHAIPPAARVATISSTMLTVYGVCHQHKGLLPWRTLGLQEFDIWGNRLTYRVDPAFSNALLGFDERSRADIFDFRLPTTQTPDGERRYTPRLSRDQSGAIVCSRIAADGCPSLGESFANLQVGLVITTNLILGPREFPPLLSAQNGEPPQGIVDGLPAVVLSHGRNGAGAMRFDAANSAQCIPSLPPQNVAENANAYYGGGHPFHPCYQSHRATVDVYFGENVYVETPLVFDSPNASDDVVEYTSVQQLLAFLLRAGVVPVERLEFLPD